MVEDIFDLTDVTDLPVNYQAFFKKCNPQKKKRWGKSVELLDQIKSVFMIAKRPLTLNELLVGLYRSHNVLMRRKALRSWIYFQGKRKDTDIKQVNHMYYTHACLMSKQDFKAIKPYKKAHENERR